MKWYTTQEDISPIITCRVRLARNFKKYNFAAKLTKSDAEKMIEEISENLLFQQKIKFEYINIMEKEKIEKLSLVEHHKISLDLLRGEQPRGVLSSEDDTIHIMVNEEDHVRIQCISPGKDIQSVYDKATNVDDIIEQKMEYAFDEKLGYLTSCPSNIGTGTRASYMLHLPMLERSNEIDKIFESPSAIGMTIRGIYGESSKSISGIYQISNQFSLGRSEEDIIVDIENLTKQIVEAETSRLDKHISINRVRFEDDVYRAYGALKYARRLDVKEARKLLSILRLGAVSGVLKSVLSGISVYGIMMNIEQGNLYLKMLSHFNGEMEFNRDMDIYRADFIRKALDNEKDI